jgi:hypothetical protein
VTLVLALIPYPQAHEIAGAAPYEQACYGLRLGMDRSQLLLLREADQVSHGPMGQHASHLAQGERACDVEEVAHESGEK